MGSTDVEKIAKRPLADPDVISDSCVYATIFVFCIDRLEELFLSTPDHGNLLRPAATGI